MITTDDAILHMVEKLSLNFDRILLKMVVIITMSKCWYIYYGVNIERSIRVEQ